MQKTWVPSLVPEDPPGQGAIKSGYPDYWACALEPGNCNSRVGKLQLLSPQATTTEAHTPQSLCSARRSYALPLESSPCSPQLEKSPLSKEDLAQPKLNKIVYKKEEARVNQEDMESDQVEKQV